MSVKVALPVAIVITMLLTCGICFISSIHKPEADRHDTVLIGARAMDPAMPAHVPPDVVFEERKVLYMTTMVVDLSQGEMPPGTFPANFPQENHPVRHEAFPVRANGDESFTAGTITVYRYGDDGPSTIPIRWSRTHGVADFKSDNTFMAYHAAIKLNLSHSDGVPVRYVLRDGELPEWGPGTDEILFYSNITFAGSRHSAVSSGRDAMAYNNSILPGSTNWHSSTVGDSIESLIIDMKWKNPESKLRLIVYTPDGQVLGPYYDDSDGIDDGRINLDVANQDGIADGDWRYKVNVQQAVEREEYYLRTREM